MNLLLLLIDIIFLPITMLRMLAIYIGGDHTQEYIEQVDFSKSEIFSDD